MKKTFIILASATLLSGLLTISCNSSADKLANAENNVEEAREDLDKANKEYLEDYNSYRKNTSDKIIANEKSIANFKSKIELEKNEAKNEDHKRIILLEKKNSEMRKKMDDFKADGKKKWDEFKMEFNHDMDELSKALKDFTINNEK